MGVEGQNRRVKVENEALVLQHLGGKQLPVALPLVSCFGFASTRGETRSGSSSRKLVCGCFVALSALAMLVMVFR